MLNAPRTYPKSADGLFLRLTDLMTAYNSDGVRVKHGWLSRQIGCTLDELFAFNKELATSGRLIVLDRGTRIKYLLRPEAAASPSA